MINAVSFSERMRKMEGSDGEGRRRRRRKASFVHAHIKIVTY